MQLLLLLESGVRTEAIVLSADENHMRVVAPQAKDAMELRLIKDQWMTEEGDAVDIEAIIAGGENGLARLHLYWNAA